MQGLSLIALSDIGDYVKWERANSSEVGRRAWKRNIWTRPQCQETGEPRGPQRNEGNGLLISGPSPYTYRAEPSILNVKVCATTLKVPFPRRIRRPAENRRSLLGVTGPVVPSLADSASAECKLCHIFTPHLLYGFHHIHFRHMKRYDSSNPLLFTFACYGLSDIRH